MTDDNKTPQDGATENNPAPEKTFSEGYVKDLRDENAKWRTQLRDVQQRLEALQSEKEQREAKELAEQGEYQTLYEQEQQRAQELQEQLRERDIRNAVALEAGKLGFTDPADALRMLDTKTLTVQDDGTVQGVQEALQQLAENKPYLLRGDGKPAPQRFDTPNPAGTQGNITADDLRKMSAQEIQAFGVDKAFAIFEQDNKG